MGINTCNFSVITVTSRPSCIKNLIKNFLNQNFKNKELIVVINNNSMSISDFHRFTSLYDNIHIYKLSETISLGECLNFAIENATYDYISKFDDDDYYGPYYLDEMYNTFLYNDCDIVGKYKTYTYFEKFNKLMLLKDNIEDTYNKSIMGSTICFKRYIFDCVKFKDVSYKEDYLFNNTCLNNGFKIFVNSRYNHIIFKHADNNKHTFKSNISLLIKRCTDIKSDIKFEDCFDIVNKIL